MPINSKLSANQQRFFAYVEQYLKPSNVFDEISYFKDEDGWSIFAHPAIIYEDMLANVRDSGRLSDFGYVFNIPTEVQLSDENVLIEESFRAASSLLWGYISGGRVILQQSTT